MTRPSKKASSPRVAAITARGPAGVLPVDFEAVAMPPTTRELHPHEALARPSCHNGAIAHSWNPFGTGDLSLTIAELQEKSREVAAGGTTSMESLLIGQAFSLQTIYTALAARAAKAEHLTQLEPLLRMALKAQNQSRMTLETLAVIKNPPVVFARQANINQGGMQQVNNGVSPPVTPAARAAAEPVELFERKGIEHVEPLDAGAPATPGGADRELATVGAVYRPADPGGQGQERREQLPRGREAGRTRAATAAARGDGGAPRRAGSAVKARRT